MFAVIATACSGGSDAVQDPDVGTEAAEQTTSAEDDIATEPEDGPEEDLEVEVAPVRGGKLVALIEAETDTWDIPVANCAAGCGAVMTQVADPLLTLDENGEIQPWLLEDYQVNDDFTVHTLTMRPGVTFHDGTPADGAAVRRHLIEMADGLLQGQVFIDLAQGSRFSGGDPAESIQLIDDMTVTVSFSKPFAAFANHLTGRTGWLIAPSFWDNPDRASALMVATGPFEMVEHVSDEVTRLEANTAYWRKDEAGQQLPYLEAIDFRPVPDPSTRRATMDAGDADIAQDGSGENEEYWKTEWVEAGNSLAPEATDREVSYLLLNTSQPPFDDPEVRRGLALCTDRELYRTLRSPNDDLVDGPFGEGSLGFLDDPGFPQFDPEAGSALFDSIGRPDVINYGTASVPSSLLTAELFANMWSENCGLNVNIDQFDQSELITRAVTGNFDTFQWRNHGSGNPALEFVWWHSRHAEGLALNFGRIVDPRLDELLVEARATIDRTALDDIAKEINRVFADEVYNLWLNTNEWYNPVTAETHGVNNVTIDGRARTVGQLYGNLFLHETWLSES